MSYVVTEPFGTIIVECVCMLVRHGYLISVFNTSIIFSTCFRAAQRMTTKAKASPAEIGKQWQ